MIYFKILFCLVETNYLKVLKKELKEITILIKIMFVLFLIRRLMLGLGDQ